MSKKKIILSISFFLVVISLTFYTIFTETSLDTLVENLKLLRPGYFLLCLVLVFLYFLVQGIYTKMILKSLNTKVSLGKSIFYSIVEFFFSAITPSSTGGQPIELFYMKKDKIPIRKSLITLVLATIYFKLFMVVFGVLLLIFKNKFIFDNLLVTILFFIGMAGDILMVVGCYLLIYKQSIMKKILKLWSKIVRRFKPNYEDKTEEMLKNYKNETIYIEKHKKEVAIGLILAFIQRIIMFSVAYVIYRAFNLSGLTYIDLLAIQISVQMCIEFIPLPGGSGVSEHLFVMLFLDVFGKKLASTGMILIRACSFYIPLVIICLVIVITTKIKYMKRG